MFPSNFLAKFPHSWATGFDIPLAELINIAVDLYPHTRPLKFPPRTALINPLPIRESGLDNTMSTQGKPTTVLRFDYLPLAAFQYIIDSKFRISDVDVPDREMTVNLENVEAAMFQRWNARVFRPVPERDYNRDGNNAVPVSIPMLLLEYLPEPP